MNPEFGTHSLAALSSAAGDKKRFATSTIILRAQRYITASIALPAESQVASFSPL